MDILEDIKKLDAFLANQNIDYSDSDSVHTEDLGIDGVPTSKDSGSDEPEPEADDSFDMDPDVKETIENCSDNNLRFALICNRKKRHILSKIHNKLTASLMKLTQYQMAKNNKMSAVNERKCGLRIRLGVPYFKDNASFPSPPNADIVAMRNNDQMPQFSYKHITWRRDEKTKLVVAVYTEISEKRVAEISRLISRADNSSDLLKLKDIFGNRAVIGALARNWAEDTLENVEERIAKMESDAQCNTEANPEPSTSGTEKIKSKFKLIFEPSTSSTIDNNTRELIDTLTNKIKADSTKKNNSDSELKELNNPIVLTNEKKGKSLVYSKSTPSSSTATLTNKIKADSTKKNNSDSELKELNTPIVLTNEKKGKSLVYSKPTPSTSNATLTNKIKADSTKKNNSDSELKELNNTIVLAKEKKGKSLVYSKSTPSSSNATLTNKMKADSTKKNNSDSELKELNNTIVLKNEKKGKSLVYSKSTPTLTNKIKSDSTKKSRKNADSELKNPIVLTNEKKGKSLVHSKPTPSTSNAIDTSKNVPKTGTVLNPKPSTSFATNIDLNPDSNELNPITLNTSNYGKSLDSDSSKSELIALKENRTILQCIANWSKQDIDWYKISVTHFDNRHEDFECAALWSVYLNPGVSKKPWTNLQSEALKEQAVANNFENWDLIAKNLNINKTAYQCCVHFHSKLSQKYNSDSWTPDEDAELKQVVELCRFGDSISWGKVAFYFRNRSRVQIYNRYRYALAPVKKGTFSEAEDVLLLTLVKIFDKDMTRIVTYFKDRQVQQLRNRLASMAGNIREWSLEDDQAIIQHVHRHGEKDWKLLDLGRNPAHLRHRFTFIKKWFDMHPAANLAEISRRNKGKHKLRSQTRSQITDPLVEQLTLQAKGLADNSEILNIPYIEKQLEKIPAFKANKVITGRKPKSKLSLDELLLNYFKPTHKHTGRAITNVDNHLDESVERIRLIWSFLNVHLEIPNVETLENHPKLDAFDVKVLSRLKQMPPLPDQMQSYVIPPTPETLVGYRGLWLLHPRLCNQSKGIMEGLYYADTEAPLFKKVRGYNFCKAQLEQYLSSLPDEMKQEVLNERQLFWRRFYVLFKWPCLLSILPKIPEVTDTTVMKPKPVQIGRPKRNMSERVQRMNDARLEKKRKEMEETPGSVDIVELNPEKKPKTN